MKGRAASLALVAFTLLACSASPRSAAPRSPSAAQTPAKKRRLSIVVFSRVSGSSELTVQADGTREEVLEILENGRGPKVTARSRLGNDGTFAEFHATGQNGLGTAVDERFARDGELARWSGLEESGTAPLNGTAFYVPRATLVDPVAVLADALERAGGALPLLPSGEARLEKVGETTVSGNGGSRRVIAYAIHGLDLTPVRFWRDADGSFFGVTEPWLSAVPEGFESAVDDLLAAQRRFERAADERLAKQLARVPPDAGLAITHARVLDVEKGVYRTNQTVIVRGSKIVSIGPSATTTAPSSAMVLDASGKTLIPGLWDMHTHLAAGEGVLDLACGVTTARDLGNDEELVEDAKQRFDNGTAIGPHLLRAGFIEGRGPLAAASAITAETESEALAAVEHYASKGYEQIKVYSSVSRELVPIIAKAAHAKGLRVSGHVPAFMRAEDVVRAGFDEIQHINMLFLNFLADESTDTRTPLRFTLVAERGSDVDLEGKPFRAFVGLLKERGTVIDPTLNVFEDMFLDRPGAPGPGFAAVAARLPSQALRKLAVGGLPVPAGMDATYRASFDAALRMTKALHDAGVPLVAGTDSLPGLMLHRELELQARAGVANDDVLYNATLGSAKVMGRAATTGSIAPGKDADLALIDGDPLKTISDVARVVTVVRGGIVYDARELARAAAIAPLD